MIGYYVRDEAQRVAFVPRPGSPDHVTVLEAAAWTASGAITGVGAAVAFGVSGGSRHSTGGN